MVTSASRPKIRVLENGDRLTRTEFERRYANMPKLKKAELIEGVVYMASALRYRKHGKPHGNIMAWLGVYAAYTTGVELADNATVRLDLDNEPQPDALLRLDEEHGGQSEISEDDYIEGAPELIVEIAASTVSYDLHDKLRAYRRNGVQEYLIWLVEDTAFHWYLLRDGEYVLQEQDAAGLLKSEVFPGLWLVVNDLLAGRMRQVLVTLNDGLASEGYQKFLNQFQE